MKHKLGIVLIILGCGLITAALALFLRNQQEQTRAANASQEAIVKVVEVIRENREPAPSTEPAVSTEPGEVVLPTLPKDRVMTVAEIDGYGYIGFLGLPSLELELPVMAEWSYPRLQIAPCRYTGSIFTDDLVIMAHNYSQHFGKIKDMRPGDTVTFTDMEGETVEYQVVALEILEETAIADVISGQYDLTLFTCTYGGENRVAIRCDRVKK